MYVLKIENKDYELNNFTLGDFYRLEKKLGLSLGKVFEAIQEQNLEILAEMLFLLVSKKYSGDFKDSFELLDKFEMKDLTEIYTAITALLNAPKTDTQETDQLGKPPSGTGKKQN